MKNTNLFLHTILSLATLNTFPSESPPSLRRPTKNEIFSLHAELHSFHTYVTSEATKRLTQEELKDLLRRPSSTLQNKAHLTNEDLKEWKIVRKVIKELRLTQENLATDQPLSPTQS